MHRLHISCAEAEGLDQCQSTIGTSLLDLFTIFRINQIHIPHSVFHLGVRAFERKFPNTNYLPPRTLKAPHTPSLALHRGLLRVLLLTCPFLSPSAE